MSTDLHTLSIQTRLILKQGQTWSNGICVSWFIDQESLTIIFQKIKGFFVEDPCKIDHLSGETHGKPMGFLFSKPAAPSDTFRHLPTPSQCLKPPPGRREMPPESRPPPALAVKPLAPGPWA
jgi:hypothetical protein